MYKSPWWWFALLIIGVLLGAGILLLVTRPPRGKPIELIPPPTAAPITVYVSGAVKSPGLVNLAPGSRLNDAILAAGGLTEDAIPEGLNLARLLEDGEAVFVPNLTTPAPSSGELNRSGTPRILVNINLATIEELDTLPEIGPNTAKAIVAYRTANGAFARIEDILEVDGIGPVTFDKIKDLITIGISTP